MRREWYAEFLRFMDGVEERGVSVLFPMYYYSDVRQSEWFAENPDMPFQFFRSRQAFSDNSRVVPDAILDKLEGAEELDDDELAMIILPIDGYKISPFVLSAYLTGYFWTFASSLLRWHAGKNGKGSMVLGRGRLRDMAENFVSKRYAHIDDIRRRRSERLYSMQRKGNLEVKTLRAEALSQSATMSRLVGNNFANKLMMMQMKHLYPGGIITKGWLSKRDVRVRRAHRIADRVYRREKMIPLDDLFYVGGEFLPYPTGGNKPSNNVNCRCVLSFKVK